MTDLSFLTNTRSRRALEAAGIATLEQALAAGQRACLGVKFVAETTWLEILEARFSNPPVATIPESPSDHDRLNHVIRFLRGQCSDLPEVE